MQEFVKEILSFTALCGIVLFGWAAIYVLFVYADKKIMKTKEDDKNV